MSWKHLSWAADTRSGSVINKTVLILLAHAANDAAQCWPSQATLARRAECSVRAINSSLRALEALGLIERKRRWDGRGHRTSDLITLTLAQGEPVADRESTQSEQDAPRDEDPTCTSFRPNLQMVPPLHAPRAEESTSERTNERTIIGVTPLPPAKPWTIEGLSGESVTIPEAFELWWAEWPNKVKRKESAQLFERILQKRQATFAELMHGQRRYALTDRVRRGYIQNPTTWLRGEGWKDEHLAAQPATTRAAQPRQAWSAVDQAIAGLVADDAEPMTGRAA